VSKDQRISASDPVHYPTEGVDMKLSHVASTAAWLASGLALAGAAHAQSGYSVVMTGLDNPRGLAFAPYGALYVAEAGRGGSGPCAPGPVGETRCAGASGAISRLWHGVQSRVAEGLPSNALPDGSGASGPNDISFIGTGNAFITVGVGGNAAFRAALGDQAAQAGTLVQMQASGRWHVVADLLQHEEEHNPAGGPVDSNPFGVLAEPGGRLVADAGANAILSVHANGAIETLAVLGPQPNPTPVGPPWIESVPTTVARGPDGALYVGQLTGVPFVQGLAAIYRLVAGEAPVVHCGGFKTIVDMAFAPDGHLYVVENATGGLFFPPQSGQLSRVAADCSRSVLLGGLDQPTSVAVDRDGAVYVTNQTTLAGAGQVLRVVP
jgi:hypothetical protein